MLVLYETSLGYCLFKVTDSGKIGSADLWKEFESPEKAAGLLKLRAIHRFKSTAHAVEEVSSLQEGKISKGLKKFLTAEIVDKGKSKDSLTVTDPKLAGSISKKLGISVTADSSSIDLYRGIRNQLNALLGGLDEKDLGTFNLGLSHSLSRFKLKFSPDKVDTMVVQAIALLDDLDKEINIYSMRVKEWYGWHFPEMGKILTDNLAYAKVVKAMGFRTNAATTDFSSVLPEELEQTIRVAAEISMGTEISDTDINHIHALCDQVISITAYRTQLADYLRNRMAAIAPNLTALVGDLVGARLISHAGSLMNLAKYPASTVQILGAEKALFRALKTKHDTPKYGLIYHASLVGQAPPKLKGKMARMVATKAALSIRLDALTDVDGKSEPSAPSIGIENRAKLESRLRALQYRDDLNGIPSVPRKQPKFSMTGNGATYNAAADLVPAQRDLEPVEAALQAVVDVKEEKKRAKEERREKKRRELEKQEETKAAIVNGGGDMDVDGEEPSASEKKKAKKRRRESEANGDVSISSIKPPADDAEEDSEAERNRRKKEKKAAKKAAAAAAATEEGDGDASPEPKKKKKKHSAS